MCQNKVHKIDVISTSYIDKRKMTLEYISAQWVNGD